MSKVKKKPENPQAFSSYSNENDKLEMGMTLRDYFAAKAMQALYLGALTSEGAAKGFNKKGENLLEIVSESAYDIADAMLEERSK